ncbi:hypothetical protein DFS34DRAFT_81039 [Phlyctochytrium arcticum]|nr:hypothetical protein DFS34DRAFT_81039 [Phlyctochytrium arcticum]
MPQAATTLSAPQAEPAWKADLDSLRKSSKSLFKPINGVAAHPLKSTKEYTTSTGAICHGRVANLESMVPAAWWQTVFADAMYLKTDGDVVEDPDITKEEVGLLEADPEIKKILMRGATNGTQDGQGPAAQILDLCCGQGRHVLHLAQEYPHLGLHGHDQSSYLISLAKERASLQSGCKPAFTVGDCRQIPYADHIFDLVMVMGNSFGYFSDENGDKVVLEEILRVLAPGGRLILDLTDGDYMRDNFAERSWEWIDDITFVCRERQLSKDGLRLSSREVVSLTTKGVVRDQFYQERLYGRTEVEALVQDMGFDLIRDVNKADPITLGKDLSKRKEDLGMMEQRVLINALKPPRSVNGVHSAKGFNGINGVAAHANGTAKLSNGLGSMVTNGTYHPESLNGEEENGSLLTTETDTAEKSQITVKAPPFERITVLLGDPSRPCVGKLNNTWNPEDLETRQKLIAVLHELGYSPEAIDVLDSHESYMSLLKTNSPEFVFNLCDEGFDNDALQELHVPALLDMLHIPYSGAGPNCLAHCYDKGLVNRTAASIGVPTPRETFYFADTATPAVQDIAKLHAVISQDIGYPAFIKPVKGDNSLGITCRSIVNNEQELDTYVTELQTMGIRDMIVQEYLDGPEYGVGMIGNRESGFHFFPILEVDYTQITAQSLPPILGYESKWDPTSPYWTDIGYKAATGLSPSTIADLKTWCIALWDRFGCRDYARFDFRSDRANNTIKLLEVNPNPGWCWDGKFVYMGKLEGLTYGDVIGMILNAAWDRLHGQKTQGGRKTVTENGTSIKVTRGQ